MAFCPSAHLERNVAAALVAVRYLGVALTEHVYADDFFYRGGELMPTMFCRGTPTSDSTKRHMRRHGRRRRGATMNCYTGSTKRLLLALAAHITTERIPSELFRFSYPRFFRKTDTGLDEQTPLKCKVPSNWCDVSSNCEVRYKSNVGTPNPQC